MRDAEGKRGLDRARALDAAFSGIDPGIQLVFYPREVHELLDLAKEDAALTKKRTAVLDQRLMNEIADTYREHGEGSDGEGGIRAMREFAAKYRDRPALFEKAAMLEMDATFDQICAKRDWESAIRAMGEFESRFKDQPTLRQKALANQSMGYFLKEDLDQCIAILEAALEFDKSSELAGQLERMHTNLQKKNGGG